MKKHTFIADGKITDFYFTGNFFLKSNIIVEVNGKPATNYNLICVSNGRYADIPFTGGQVHFYKPPKAADIITIYRDLPLNRIVDYQATSTYDPVALNHDMNYLMEVIKGLRADIDSVSDKCTEFTDNELLSTVLQRLDIVTPVLEEVGEKIDNIGDTSAVMGEIDKLDASVKDLTSRVVAQNTHIDALESKQNEVVDYVVETQEPTAANNYTWYRKYASGWVEQGGRLTVSNVISATNVRVMFPVEMEDTKYVAMCANNANVALPVFVGWETTTGMSIGAMTSKSGLTTWAVYGRAKQ